MPCAGSEEGEKVTPIRKKEVGR